MQKTITQLVARAERVVERHRNQESSFKCKEVGQNETSQLLGVLIHNTLFTCESTKVYRILKDKSTRREHQVGNSRLALNMDLKDKRQNVSSTELCDFSFLRK